MADDPYIKPKAISVLTDVVRPGAMAMMVAFITVLPLFFALLELGIHGVGSKLAGVLAGYFQAIPDTFYSTIQVMFVGYVAGKSAEVVSGNIKSRNNVNVPSDNTTINVGNGEGDGPKG